jgi:DNA-binding beta-propeller fold protein YncE
LERLLHSLLIAALPVAAPGQESGEGQGPAHFGTPIGSILGLEEPSSCAILADGSMFVLEALPGRLTHYDAAGAVIGRFGELESGARQLLDPGDVELFQGELFVADSGNHRICVFDTAGKPLRSFGAFGAGPGQLNDPRGLDVTAGHLAVADARNDRVQLFDLAGKHLRSVGKHGHGEGEFNQPVDVCFDADQNVYVIDADNHRVVKLDAKGAFVSAWGDFGPFPGLFIAPSAIDFQGGRLYVTDMDNSRIQVFDTGGGLQYEWGMHALRPREAEGNLHYPSCAKVAPSGEFVVVIERFENRLQIFRRERPDDPERLAKINMMIMAHYGRSIDAAGNYVALVQPTRPEVMLNEMYRDEPVKIAAIDTHGRKPGQLSRPVDAVLDLAGERLIASDPGELRLAVFGWKPRPEPGLGFDARMLRLVVEVDFEVLFEQQPGATRWPIEPGALELGPDGELFVADPRNRTVWLLGSDYEIAGSYGGPENLKRPVDLALSKDGKTLHVVDELAGSVVHFALDMDHEAFPTTGDLRRPTGICIDRAGNVFLSDAGLHRVRKFSRDFEPIASWGRPDSQPGLGRLEFFKPGGLTCNGDGDIVVLDFGNHRGQIISPKGEFKSAFGPRLFIRPANRP